MNIYRIKFFVSRRASAIVITVASKNMDGAIRKAKSFLNSETKERITSTHSKKTITKKVKNYNYEN